MKDKEHEYLQVKREDFIEYIEGAKERFKSVEYPTNYNKFITQKVTYPGREEKVMQSDFMDIEMRMLESFSTKGLKMLAHEASRNLYQNGVVGSTTHIEYSESIMSQVANMKVEEGVSTLTKELALQKVKYKVLKKYIGMVIDHPTLTDIRQDWCRELRMVSVDQKVDLEKIWISTYFRVSLEEVVRKNMKLVQGSQWHVYLDNTLGILFFRLQLKSEEASTRWDI